MPPGALVTLLQKALLFLYVETHVANDGQTIQCDEAFSLLKPHDHDHGPLDAQIQFDESIADQINGNGKRPESVSCSDEKNAKKSKQGSSVKSSASPALQPSTGGPVEDTTMNDSTKTEEKETSTQPNIATAVGTPEPSAAEPSAQADNGTDH